MISYNESFELTIKNITPLKEEQIDLLDGNLRAVSKDLFALVDSPSINASLKDGFAIHSEEVQNASPRNPVVLRIIGSISAGETWKGKINSGEVVRILSGAPVPVSADAVVAEEFVRVEGDRAVVVNDAYPGRNILKKGSDVSKSQLLIKSGENLSPTKIGLLAAAGYEKIPVHRNPHVAIMATGDEVITPGMKLVEGKLFASNLVTLAAWCRKYGFKTYTCTVPDDIEVMKETLIWCLENYDVVISSGGAWNGERDLVINLLDELGWEKIYHRVRIGPGKAVGFGIFEEKPVFCLPGGPPSNHMAFLQLALPGLHQLAGWSKPGIKKMKAILIEDVKGQVDWTQFVHGKIKIGSEGLIFVPMNSFSRLKMMAEAEGIIMIPEGEEIICKGETVEVQIL